MRAGRAARRSIAASFVVLLAGCALKLPPSTQELQKEALPNPAVPAA